MSEAQVDKLVDWLARGYSVICTNMVDGSIELRIAPKGLMIRSYELA